MVKHRHPGRYKLYMNVYLKVCTPESIYTWIKCIPDKMSEGPSVKGLKFQKSLCPTEISLNGTFILTKHYVTCPEESVFFLSFYHFVFSSSNKTLCDRPRGESVERRSSCGTLCCEKNPL